MQRYLMQRIILLIPTLLMASIAIFFLMRIMPGDVAYMLVAPQEGEVEIFSEADLAKVREYLGLNDPLIIQYGKWLIGFVTGDMGKSMVDDRPIAGIIAHRMPATFQLALYTLLVSTILSIPLGVMAAVYQDRWPDYIFRVVTVLGMAMPSFFVALLLLLALVLVFHWIPPLIYYHLWENPVQHMGIMVWAIIPLVWHNSALMIRLTRSGMLEVLRQDYIRTAHSKGLSPRMVLWRHALRNVMIPVITVQGSFLGALLGGTVILEQIFSIPGIGSEFIRSINSRDYLVTQNIAMLFVSIMIFMNLSVDIAYAFLDPRIKYG